MQLHVLPANVSQGSTMLMNMVIATIGALSLDIVEIQIPIKKVPTAEAVKKVIFDHMSINF